MENYQVTLSNKFWEMFHREPSPKSIYFISIRKVLEVVWRRLMIVLGGWFHKTLKRGLLGIISQIKKTSIYFIILKSTD